MDIQNYLQQHQKRIFDFFSKSINEDNVPHSMIFSGQQGTLLKESAIFIAKSMLCHNKNPFACNSCKSCKDADKNINTHLYVFDTKMDQIKKQEFVEMFNNFNFSSSDKNVKYYFYIINEAENLSDKILNSLLKILEEPNSNVFAILTTHNEYKLLPTIISRCRIFKFNQINRNEIIAQCKEKNIDILDAELLSKIYNSADLIEQISKDKFYINAKEMFLTEILSLPKNVDKFFFNTIQELKLKSLNLKEGRFFLELLSVFFEEIFSFKYHKELFLHSLQKEIEDASNMPVKQIYKGIKLISEANGKLNWNCNVSLIIDNLNYSLKSK